MAKIIMIAMSLRKESFNKKLITNAKRILEENHSSHEVELLSFNDFPMSVYNADTEKEEGFSKEVLALAGKMKNADAIIISTPEYNGSIPGPFKNALDWVSRVEPIAWAGKQILLMGASPGALGAIRGLWHSRNPFEATGGFVYPDMFGLPKANEAFDDQGKLKDPKTEERVSKFLMKFSEHLKSHG